MTSSPLVRPATAADLPAIGRLHAATARAAYADIFPPEAEPPTPEALADQWGATLARCGEGADVLVATVPTVDETDRPGGPAGSPVTDEPGTTIVGAVAVAPDASVPSGLLLQRLYVDTGHQGAGIGAALHDRAVERARARGATAIDLWVLEANDRARRIYEHRGWRLVPGRTLANEPPTVLDVLYHLDLT